MPFGFTALDGFFQVNTGESGDQTDALMVQLTVGHVVVWENWSPTGVGLGVSGQLFDADGNAVGSEFDVVAGAGFTSMSSTVTALTNGGFVVSLSTYDGALVSVTAQVYDAGGVAVGSPITPPAISTGYELAALPGGGFVMVWAQSTDTFWEAGLFSQYFDENGMALGDAALIAGVGRDFPSIEALMALPDGGYVTVIGNFTDGYWLSFEDTLGDGSLNLGLGTGFWGSYDLTPLQNGGFVLTESQSYPEGPEEVVRVFDANGALVYQKTGDVGDPGPVDTFNDLAEFDDGGFVLTWVKESDSVRDVYGQRFDAAGQKVGDEFAVETHNIFQNYGPVNVATLPDGGFIIVWTAILSAGGPSGVFGLRFGADGQPVGDQFQISPETQTAPTDVQIEVMPNGTFTILWENDGGGTTATDIYAQHFAHMQYGTFADETMAGDGANNWLAGQGGDDVVLGRDGSDHLLGGTGRDWLVGGSGKDILIGQAGTDRLSGGDGKDKLKGGIGADKLFGGTGEDILIGGWGKDKLTGGSGRDTFVFKDGYGHDVIRDFKDDADTIQLAEILWSGGLTKQQVIDTYAYVDNGDIVFDFGADQLRLKGFNDLGELKDDMGFI